MQQVSSVDVNKLPANGYIKPSREEKKAKIYKDESHIPKQNAFRNIDTNVKKLYNDVLTYFPKGFKGSKNSDFYEFLSMGLVPYLIGGATMIAGYGAANPGFNCMDRKFASKICKEAAAGVVLYGVLHAASRKLSRTLINASTGVDLDLKVLNKCYEVPEPGQDAGLVRAEQGEAFSSVEFPRIDLLEQDAELNHGDKNYYYDKITRKMGYKERLNAPGQIANKKIREVKTRAQAMENIIGYIPAVTGVALGWQKAFGDLRLNRIFNFKNKKIAPVVNLSVIPKNIKILGSTLVKAAKQLWEGNTRNNVTKNFGKVLIIGAVAATVANWLVPTAAFKKKPDTLKSKVDTNKEYEVC